MKKRHLLIICALFISALSHAQVAQKYLAGAVPTVDGKVVFTQVINVPGIPQQQLTEIMRQWATQTFSDVANFPTHQVVICDVEKGEIGATGEGRIVFTSSALSFDWARIYYLLLLQCTEGRVEVTISRVRYLYNEARNGGEKYTAEEIITDEECLYKEQTKLMRGFGKFRIKTIDYKDDLFRDIASFITASLQEHLPTSEEEAAPKEITIDLQKGAAQMR